MLFMSDRRVAIYVLQLIILSSFICVAFANAQTSEKWVQIGTSNSDFSASFPENFDFLRSEDSFDLWAKTPDLNIRVRRYQNVWGARQGLKPRNYPKKPTRFDEIAVGSLLGHRAFWLDDQGLQVASYLSSKKHIYDIDLRTVSSRNQKDLERFIKSIKLAGEQIFTEPGTSSVDTTSKLIFEVMPNSQLVDRYLQVSANKDVTVVYGPIEPAPPASPNGSPKSDTKKYSRDLLIFRTPRAEYTSSARMRGINGTIRVRVKLMSDGRVGEILIDPTLNRSLAKNVEKAVRAIKFIPAEVDGIPVDSVRYMEYNFNLY
jgi:TonB family C-terminal domain